VNSVFRIKGRIELDYRGAGGCVRSGGGEGFYSESGVRGKWVGTT
jgi:hypothetical protein